MTTKTRRVFAASISFNDAGVERDGDGVPTAFRIFRAGVNVTDYGTHLLTPGAVRALLDEQDERGNRYAIDINHCSIDKTVPLENQRAVGSFAIEARNGELWAVDLRFDATTRAQIKAGSWPSISPVFHCAKDGEIVSLTNIALTPNPATHGAVRIAASRPAPALAAAATSGLRVVAADPAMSPGARAAARSELVRRGEMTIDDVRSRERIDRAFAPYLPVPANRPIVDHRGKTSTFHACTREQAQHAVRVLASRPKRTHRSPQAAEMDRRMGVAGGLPLVVHAGRVSTFNAPSGNPQ